MLKLAYLLTCCWTEPSTWRIMGSQSGVGTPMSERPIYFMRTHDCRCHTWSHSQVVVDDQSCVECVCLAASVHDCPRRSILASWTRSTTIICLPWETPVVGLHVAGFRVWLQHVFELLPLTTETSGAMYKLTVEDSLRKMSVIHPCDMPDPTKLSWHYEGFDASYITYLQNHSARGHPATFVTLCHCLVVICVCFAQQHNQNCRTLSACHRFVASFYHHVTNIVPEFVTSVVLSYHLVAVMWVSYVQQSNLGYLLMLRW